MRKTQYNNGDGNKNNISLFNEKDEINSVESFPNYKEEKVMKKIKADINQKDRVVCVTVQGAHEFYYQPVDSKERILLFVTKDFSGSVFAYFRDNGINASNRGFSLTVKELYEFNCFYNVKLSKVINRIPTMIERVLRDQFSKEKKADKDVISFHDNTIYATRCENRELAA